MRAGARELLTDPVHPSILAEALVRASARRSEVRRQKKVTGKMLVFIGAKGGSGVTTIASNFAIALAKESGRRVVLVDMDMQLGDAGLAIGLKPEFSIMDALRNADRLDSDLLATLLTRHSSGLSVLAAPDEYTPFRSLDDRAGKVLRTLREDFSYIVVDAGANFGTVHDDLLELAETIYLVTEVNIPALRNAHRLISHFEKSDVADRLELVLNRFDGRGLEIDEERVAKALTRPAKWKIPNDYSAVRRAQNTGIPVASEDTSISRMLFDMARAACGKQVTAAKKKRFGLFG
jgi:pilus assembly protein CpaE